MWRSAARNFSRNLESTTDELEAQAERLRQDGATAIFLAVDGKPSGVIGIADPVRATTADALKALVDANIRVIMLTGDNRTTAQAVAQAARHLGGRSRRAARTEG